MGSIRRRRRSQAGCGESQPGVQGGGKGPGWERPAGRRQAIPSARGPTGGARGCPQEGAGGGPGVEEVSGAGGVGGSGEAGEASCLSGLSPVSSPRVWAAALLLW